MYKGRVAIIGTGNIGSDLLIKLLKSEYLQCTLFAGQNPDSPNLKLASNMGVETSADSIQALVDRQNDFDIVMDATSAEAHMKNESILNNLGKYIINLTPTHKGLSCVPCINGDDRIHSKEIDLISCGGQSTIPLAYSVVQTGCDVSYIETVSTISSESAGNSTRENIDQFIETTSGEMRKYTNVDKTKAIMIINSNYPQVNMRNTIYMKVKNGDIVKIGESVKNMEKNIQKYVTGYKVIVEPCFIEDILTITLEVCGSGDFLPKFAGNLDIITCVAVEMAERYSKEVLNIGGG